MPARKKGSIMLRNSLAVGAFCLTSLIACAETFPSEHLDAGPLQNPASNIDETPEFDFKVNAEVSLDRLRVGNSRYVLGESTFPRSDASRRYETVSEGQHPFATILSCSDSRVPAELIFDAGIGDLFVIRVAGNVADVDEIASIEYGADHLGTPVVVVMGHTACGAVTAVASGAELHGHLGELTNNIQPAVTNAQRENPKLAGDRLVTQSIRWNVRQAQSDLIENSETIRRLVSEGKVKVVGAIYDLHSGSVLWLGEHPDQARLLDPTNATTYSQFDTPAQPETFVTRTSPSHMKQSPETLTHDTTRGSSDHGSKDSHAGQAEDEPVDQTEAAPISKSERHGLMVPAMFMLGGVALSSTLVFLIRTRHPLPPAKSS